MLVLPLLSSKHMMRIAVLALVLTGLFSGCTDTSDFEECPEPPALAAAGSVVALSCAETVTFEGRTYLVEGGKFHASWVGKQIADKGGGGYEGAYKVRTLPVEEVIALANARGGEFVLAFTDEFDESDQKAVKEPFGSS